MDTFSTRKFDFRNHKHPPFSLSLPPVQHTTHTFCVDNWLKQHNLIACVKFNFHSPSHQQLIFPFHFSPHLKTESFDGREKPSVLVTSPGSPDFNYQQKLQPSAHHKRLGRYQGRFSHSTSIDPNIGGRVQIKLGFEASALQLIVTVVCAADLTFRPNGSPRNPYAKVSVNTHIQKLLVFFFYDPVESEWWHFHDNFFLLSSADIFASLPLR